MKRVLEVVVEMDRQRIPAAIEFQQLLTFDAVGTEMEALARGEVVEEHRIGFVHGCHKVARGRRRRPAR